MGNKKSLVVIGNGIVGQHFLVSFGVAAKEGYVFMAFYEELRLAYDRGHLSSFFADKTVEDLKAAFLHYISSRIQMTKRLLK